MTLRDCTCSSDKISITWDDGDVSEYHAIWLADNNPAHRDVRNQQRLIDVADLPADPRIASGYLSDGCVRLVWTDQTVSEFSLDWLFLHRPGTTRKRNEKTKIRTWGRSDIDLLHRDSLEQV